MPRKPGQIPKRPTIAWLKRELKAADRLANDALRRYTEARETSEATAASKDRTILDLRERIAYLPTIPTLQNLVKELRTHSALARRIHAVASRRESQAGAGVAAVTWERAADLLEAAIREAMMPPSACGASPIEPTKNQAPGTKQPLP